MNKKKVVIFGIKTFPAFAGADRVVENLVNNENGEFDPYIYLLDTAHKVPCSENRHFIYLPSIKGKHLNAFSFFFLCTVHMYLFGKYDIIHAHNSDVGLFTYLLKYKYKNKIVGTFHGNPYESAKWGFFAKKFLRMSERLFVQSCTKLTSVCQRNITWGKKVVFIPNGVEEIKEEEFAEYQNTVISYEKLSIEKGKYILFASGRLDRRKGLHYLLDAYGRSNFNNQLVIVSDFSHDAEYSNLVESKVRQLNKSNVIVLKKLLPKNDLYDLIRNAIFVVFPSEIEAMSMFVLEVLACNQVLLCSDIDSNVQIVGKDYKYMFKSKDVNSLLNTLRRALEDVQSNNLESNRCKKQQLQQKYSWKKIVGDYCSIYKSLES